MAVPEITDQLISQLEKLSKLRCEEEEKDELKSSLVEILQHFSLLANVEAVEESEDATQPDPTSSSLRPDETKLEVPPQDFIDNVPRSSGSFIEVPLVIGESDEA